MLDIRFNYSKNEFMILGNLEVLFNWDVNKAKNILRLNQEIFTFPCNYLIELKLVKLNGEWESSNNKKIWIDKDFPFDRVIEIFLKWNVFLFLSLFYLFIFYDFV
jgi:hypothetical protein